MIREAGRPFIEHQIEIADFQVALHRALQKRDDIQLLRAEYILAAAPATTREARNPFLLRAKLSDHGWTREIGVVPDLVFGLKFADGSRRCFMVEIDRGRMPVTRADINQTSFSRKPGSSIFLFATAEALRHSNPIAHQWEEGSGRPVELI